MKVGRVALVVLAALAILGASATSASARTADAKQGIFTTCIGGVTYTGSKDNVQFYADCCRIAGGVSTVTYNSDGTVSFSCLFVSDAVRPQTTQLITRAVTEVLQNAPPNFPAQGNLEILGLVAINRYTASPEPVLG